jgi:ubiquinone/menaquinone biosynthesis C-methylase UbiE
MRRPDFIARQGRNPTGCLGAIIGRIMAGETAADNDRAITILGIQPTDSVIDVGTGHGRSLGMMAARATRGIVVGVDTSDVMLAIARRRNRALIRKGRVQVEKGASDNLPFPSASFDKALAVHTLYFWQPAEPHLRSIANILKVGGRFLLAFRPAEDTAVTAKFPAGIYTFRTTGEVASLVAACGFDVIASERRDIPGNTMVWLLAARR